MTAQRGANQSLNTSNLADLLERVLDKGVVIAGDIKVKLVDIELLTIQIRLVICSVDKAKEMGMDWWANRPIIEPAPLKTGVAGNAEPGAALEAITAMDARMARLEAAIERVAGALPASIDTTAANATAAQPPTPAPLPARAWRPPGAA